MTECAFAECDRPSRGPHGLCNAHRLQAQRGKPMRSVVVRSPRRVRRSRPTLEDRFWSKVDKTDGCWLWTGARDVTGYGRFRGPDGRTKYAHRMSYELARGRVPDGLVLDHLCRTPACVRIDHLDAVTQAINVARSLAGVASAERYQQHLRCPRGHPLFGPNLYASVTQRGYINKQCRTCRRDNSARYRARHAVA